MPQSTDLPNRLMLPTQKVLLRLRDLLVRSWWVVKMEELEQRGGMVIGTSLTFRM